VWSNPEDERAPTASERAWPERSRGGSTGNFCFPRWTHRDPQLDPSSWPRPSGSSVNTQRREQLNADRVANQG
jgi:hypothetical protein